MSGPRKLPPMPAPGELRRWRQDSGLSKSAAARLCGMGPSTFSNFEAVGFSTRGWEKHHAKVTAALATNPSNTSENKPAPPRKPTAGERARALASVYRRRNPNFDYRLAQMRAETEVRNARTK